MKSFAANDYWLLCSGGWPLTLFMETMEKILAPESCSREHMLSCDYWAEAHSSAVDLFWKSLLSLNEFVLDDLVVVVVLCGGVRLCDFLNKGETFIRIPHHQVMQHYLNMYDKGNRGTTVAGYMFGFHLYTGKRWQPCCHRLFRRPFFVDLSLVNVYWQHLCGHSIAWRVRWGHVGAILCSPRGWNNSVWNNSCKTPYFPPDILSCKYFWAGFFHLKKKKCGENRLWKL